MEIIIAKSYEEMSEKAAQIMKEIIEENPAAVIGLPTGSTPIGMYKRLSEMCQKGELSFAKATSFNIDEYVGLPESDPNSYHYFIGEHFLNNIDIPSEKTHLPNGMAEKLEEEAENYEETLAAAGYLDVLFAGIGHDGHLGFDEPGDHFQRRTNLVDLDPITIEANSRFFNNKEEVPTQAITMGIGTMMASRKIVVMASGEGKAEIVKQLVESEVTPQLPATILHFHPNALLLLDAEAAKLL